MLAEAALVHYLIVHTLSIVGETMATVLGYAANKLAPLLVPAVEGALSFRLAY